MAADSFREEYTNLVAGMLALNVKVDEKLKLLEMKEKQYNGLLAKVSSDQAVKEQWVELNVGGHSYGSSMDTFLRWEGTYFHSLLCGNLWNPCTDGAFFIDRDPANFDRIMTALRTGDPVDFSRLSVEETERLQAEIDYYQLKFEGSKREPSAIQWDSQNCSADLTITGDGRTIVKSSSGVGWSSCMVASSPDLTSFKISIGGSNKILLGYTTANKFRKHCCPGWFSSCESVDIGSASVITARLDRAARTIFFEVDGKPCKIGFTKINCNTEPLYPCVKLRTTGSVSLVD